MRKVQKIVVASIVVIVVIIMAGLLYVYRMQLRDLIDTRRRVKLPQAEDYQAAGPELSSEDILADEAGANEQDESDSVGAEQNADNVNEVSASPESTIRISRTEIPSSYNLAVPFQPQAPFANWDLPYQEACEEASLVMASRFFTNRGLSAEEMDAEIKRLVAWEQKTFGYYEDTTAQEVALMAQNYFGLSARVDMDVSVDNIKSQIANSRLVLVPAAGRILPNPYFSGEGPLYHMLIIRGYTDKYFITNDPGTKRGKEFLYSYDDLLGAVHDWPSYKGASISKPTEEDVASGQKVMIVVGAG